jgi:hypothetical protein
MPAYEVFSLHEFSQYRFLYNFLFPLHALQVLPILFSIIHLQPSVVLSHSIGLSPFNFDFNMLLSILVLSSYLLYDTNLTPIVSLQ